VEAEKRDVSKCVWHLCSGSFLHFVSSLFHRAEESTSESETVPPAQQNNLASLFFGFLFPYPLEGKTYVARELMRKQRLCEIKINSVSLRTLRGSRVDAVKENKWLPQSIDV
jgi:hypothetical protein